MTYPARCRKFLWGTVGSFTEMSADRQTSITPVRHDSPIRRRGFVMDRVEVGFVMMALTSLIVLVGALAAMVLI